MVVSPSGYKVLVLTSIYPADDVPKEWTPIVHYFAREWVRTGNQVRVVNYVSKFPSIVYAVGNLFRDKIASKAGFAIGVRPLPAREYELDGVNVLRMPMKKAKPHGSYPEKEIIKAVQFTKIYCDKNGFMPDVVVAHWANPSVVIMSELKSYYGCRTAYIAHGGGHFELFGKRSDCILESIDKIGFRSAYIKKSFEDCKRFVKPSFMCYSGIPSKYVDSTIKKRFGEIKRFLYVGTLIGRKYPAEIVIALTNAFEKDGFSMTYIGKGDEEKRILETAKKLEVEGNVKLLGRKERDEVVRQMDESDVFVMISRNEAFGLVYLEAMARGCITIASRKEGFDGIIQDGINGFLCEAGNANELAAIISRIRKMPIDELQKISDAAIQTACELTDEKTASYYLSQVIE